MNKSVRGIIKGVVIELIYSTCILAVGLIIAAGFIR